MKVKICGLTRLEDVRLAARYGADYAGFIFAESPRRITPDQARSIAAGAPSVQRVGVFVNAGLNELVRVVREAGLNMVQLHGDESPEFCRRAADRLDLPVIKALRVKDKDILEKIVRYETEYILLEPYVPGAYGGTGRTIDWNLAARIVRVNPGKKFLLAGGLNPDNVRLAARTVRPFALDASSGLETKPGVKNPVKMKTFFEEINEQKK